MLQAPRGERAQASVDRSARVVALCPTTAARHWLFAGVLPGVYDPWATAGMMGSRLSDMVFVTSRPDMKPVTR